MNLQSGCEHLEQGELQASHEREQHYPLIEGFQHGFTVVSLQTDQTRLGGHVPLEAVADKKNQTRSSRMGRWAAEDAVVSW